MVRNDWIDDRRAAAADRIYAAATDLVVRDGLDALDIDTLAARVHCSRATIYRHVGGKAQLRDAVLMRIAAGIIDTVGRAVAGMGGCERVMTAITVALEQIRSDPMRRLMMGAVTAPELSELHSSPVLSRLAAELSGLTDDDPQAARWIVHVVMSLAYLPIGNTEAEQEILRRFVAPAFS
ncbi:TetR/AcrR family transcriptional regulator [Mycobacterium decipiens]|uniref:TetR family transcriptional regulator n=1 Tax=Mycobacterium decipiens TaxID=1430326 RepID=A0A1X2LV74_9MYCO|nr:TetR family transcriptional regulator [Mycobacterium decipiens]OSC40959.1 TetR family transcriptional regulator [Mycobacterium decipiens]